MMTGNAGPFTAISAWEETITNVYMAWGLWKDGACVTYGQQSPCSGVPEGWYGIDPLLSDSIPEWWEEISGAMRSQFKVSVKCVAVASRGSRQGADIIEMSDYYFYQSGNTAVCYRVFEFDFYAININCDGRRTFVRPCDSYMVNPITGVAQNLFQAQSTINYDGAVQLLSGSPLPLPGNVVNITGGLVEWETMNTLVAGIEIDLGDGRATLTTGSKAHQSANSLMDKFSRAASPRALQI